MKFFSKISYWQLITVTVLASTLSACNQPEDTTSQEIKPTVVKLSEVSALPNSNAFKFPAVVSAVKTVDVRFEVSGRLVQLDMPAGTRVKKGHLLATIDPVPFERAVKEQQARLAQAERELTRATSMIAKGLVSQSILDDAKTKFELAELGLANAQQDLSYTKISAPFDAQVSQRFVDNNSLVSKSESIARLQDMSRTYFHISVPERLFTANSKRAILTAEAAIISAPNTWFDIEYVEHSAEPDSITQTYDVVFAMEPQPGLPLTPGARAIVRAKLQSEANIQGVLLPIDALVGSHDQGFHVWRFDSQTQILSKISVSVTHMEEAFVIVENGLNVGDKVVSAGAAKMYEGIQVKPYVAEQ